MSARRLIATVTAAVATLGLATATAGPAAANSFEMKVYQGKAWYNDGADRFCVRAQETNIRDRAVITVRLVPYDSSRGPVVTLSDVDTPGQQCKSLARAYEDTRYQTVIKSAISFDRPSGTTKWETTKVSFYS